MKRYNLQSVFVEDQIIGEIEEIEDTDGEWIKYEDVKELELDTQILLNWCVFVCGHCADDETPIEFAEYMDAPMSVIHELYNQEHKADSEKEIPETFTTGLKDISEERTVSLDKALNEKPPEKQENEKDT